MISPFVLRMSVALFLIERRTNHPGITSYPSSGDAWTAQQANHLVLAPTAHLRHGILPTPDGLFSIVGRGLAPTFQRVRKCRIADPTYLATC